MAGIQRSIDYVQQLIFGDDRTRRYTQDSPVLPDVWVAYCMNPAARQKLLLTPHFEASAGELTVHLRNDWKSEDRNQTLRDAGIETRPRMAYNQLTVAIEASFEEMVFLILPRTTWWLRVVQPNLKEYFEATMAAENLALTLRNFHLREDVPENRDLATSLWMAALIGGVLWAKDKGTDVETGIEALVKAWMEQERATEAPTVPPLEIYEGVAAVLRDKARFWKGTQPHGNDESIWLINLDRPVETAQIDSVRTIKADAAAHLFDVDCEAIRWAVIDSGIDATHPAFFCAPEKRDGKRAWYNITRVRATYDFSRVRYLLDLDWVEEVLEGDVPDIGQREAKALIAAASRDKDLERDLQDLRLHLLKGRQIDWGSLDSFLRIPHDKDYEDDFVPASSHGTHVSGILGAAEVESDDDTSGGQAGVCPDIGLYDLRVIDSAGHGDEFYVISALQFVRHLNSHQDYQVVHGANLSLSIRHEVRSFACGATPVCEESERLMSSGVVVVAAAGNRGYQVFELADNRHLEGFLAISITDPGNAEKIITVGATHRSNPHTYGVSYFSSRGPTGDGRAKPDLVAPGEKILAPVPGKKWELKDGTSMAAPHVSGAAALVLARHSELQGKPERVKEILCASATDLGREKYFQGHGLVDVLRALQSV